MPHLRVTTDCVRVLGQEQPLCLSIPPGPPIRDKSPDQTVCVTHPEQLSLKQMHIEQWEWWWNRTQPVATPLPAVWTAVDGAQRNGALVLIRNLFVFSPWVTAAITTQPCFYWVQGHIASWLQGQQEPWLSASCWWHSLCWQGLGFFFRLFVSSHAVADKCLMLLTLSWPSQIVQLHWTLPQCILHGWASTNLPLHGMMDIWPGVTWVESARVSVTARWSRAHDRWTRLTAVAWLASTMGRQHNDWGQCHRFWRLGKLWPEIDFEGINYFKGLSNISLDLYFFYM